MKKAGLWPALIVTMTLLISALLARGGQASRSAATRLAPQATGAQATLPAGARVVGPVPDTQQLHLVLGLTPRHPALLDSFVRQRRMRGSPVFGATLSPAQFASLFGASAADQQNVISYLRAHGMRVLHTYPDRLLVDAAGSAGQVEATFGTSLVRYRNRAGRLHFANATALHLASPLAGLVSTVVGLRDDDPWYRLPVQLRKVSTATETAGYLHAIHPPLKSGTQSSQHAASAHSAPPPPAGMLTPAQLQTAYDIAPLYAQSFGGGAATTITGAGETIALFELSPYDPADIAAYDSAFGLTTRQPVTVPVDGGPTGAFGASGTIEASLDIEMLHAIAPQAQTLVYSGPGLPTGTDNTGADDVYARIINDNQAQVLSTSWGQCEPDQLADTPPDETLLHTLFAQASAQGMTLVAATGDAGSNDCTDGKPNPSVDYPGSDPLGDRRRRHQLECEYRRPGTERGRLGRQRRRRQPDL